MTPLELGMVLLSALLHAAWNAYTKDTESPTAFLALTCVATMLLGAPLFLFIDFAEVPAAVWWILPAAAVINTAYLFWLGRAYEKGDLSVVYPISRSAPALVALIAVPLLDDPVSAAGAAGIAVVLAGMWLVHTGGRIAWKALLAPGIGYAYLTLLATVGYSVLDKMAMRAFEAAPWSSPVPRALVYFFLLAAGYTLLFVPIAWVRIPRATIQNVLRVRWGRMLFSAIAGVASYGLILEALRTASVSYVTAVRQSSVVFAAILSMVMLRERPTRPRILGSVLTVAGVALIALRP